MSSAEKTTALSSVPNVASLPPTRDLGGQIRYVTGLGEAGVYVHSGSTWNPIASSGALGSIETVDLYGGVTELSTIIDSIGATPTHLLIDRAMTLVATRTVPTTLAIQFIPGGLLTVSNGITLTMNGSFFAPLQKVFTLTGSGLVAFGRGTIKAVSPEWWGALGNTTTGNDGNDDTIPMQQALAAAEVDATYGGRYLELQATKYRLTGSLAPIKRDVGIRGKGRYNSVIYFNGVAAGCIVPTAMQYFRSFLSDFSIVGDASSGHGIDVSAITIQTYSGAWERLAIISGGRCINAPEKFFSMVMDTIEGTSFNDHTFFAHCGPGVKWTMCYAVRAGTGKAGYRLSGGINLDTCNGLNEGDYWGVFGSDTGGTADGFENDFPVIAYPDVVLTNCNIESFNTRGIYFCQAVLQASVIGGKVDRAGLSSAYHSLISWKKSPVPSSGVTRLRFGYMLPGSGVPNGGAALTNAWLHSLVGSAQCIDESGVFASAGITGVYSTAVAGLYPLPTALVGTSGESFQNSGHVLSAASVRRLTMNMIRYTTGSVLTPVGAGQAIVVTGLSKVIVTPAAGASITTATFVTTLGIISDAGRNGDLIIEAGNANLTVNHTAMGGAANTFVMAGAANLAMASGQVIRFLRSETTSQWIQY